MTQFLSLYADTSRYTSRVDLIKVQFMYGVCAIFSILLVIFAIIGTTTDVPGAPELPIIAFALVIGIYFIVRSGRLVLASWIFLIMLNLIMLSANIRAEILPTRSIALMAMIITIAGFLISTPGIFTFSLLAILQVLLFPNIDGMIEGTGDNFAIRSTLIIVYLALAAVVYSYNRFIEASRLSGQDIESIERVKLAEVNARITRQASARESLDNALNSTLALILENYTNLYHAQVFLIDTDGIQARLVASTGQTGQKLIERGHSLAVGSLSVIGQTTYTGKPVIAISDDKDSVHRANELLPETKLEAAFPLRVGEDIIGALDLQSKVLEELSDNDSLTFQSLANSLSLAIDSIRQFEQARARIEENQRLTEQTRTALREVERLNQRLIGRAWSEYVKGIDDELGFAVDFTNDETQRYEDWTPTLSDAVRTRNLVHDTNVIAVPLRVRGEVVGAMEFELNEDQDFTPEDLELITEVSERFGLAAENTRLVEESQRAAQRETLINQMSSSFQSAQNVEATLAEAARSISENLNAGRVKIRLGTPKPTANGKDQ